MKTVTIGWLWILAIFPLLLAEARLPPTVPGDATASPTKTLEVFVRDGCPHCADAKAYLPQLQTRYPDLQIVYRSLDTDPRAAEDLARHSRLVGEWPPGVPTFVIEGRVLVGFVSGAHTGPELDRLITGGTARPEATAKTGFRGLSAERLGLPLFTIALGLVDGFNPCAMWVLLFLLSLLVRLRDRRRMALIAGTFVFVSGAIYYAFMAAWLNLFLLVGFSHWLRWLLAGIAVVIGIVNLRDSFAGNHGYTLAIPSSAKPGIYARARKVLRADRLIASMIGVALLAVLVNVIELLCTAGLPAIYTAVLAQQDLSGSAYYGYLGLYILAYIADDALMVTLAVMALGSGKLSARGGRWLKCISGVVMLLLGLTMLFFPQILV
ncbi:hypothetical protein JF535_12240 [Microbulbifer salipaludis]|uniref:Glutaredoxin domain-containing protein n=1 Tax=Microbulbifer salipaludis TaxID=187980 RepID=A0ABS3E8J8_9GAMM|nr:glutaredoxin domain-containing protein [Microbulbifer salipaludis]MBN8431622.1 hypothetical protein [Microbulbifer salipaludis]